MPAPFNLTRIGIGLPIAAALPEFLDALGTHQRVLVQAPPGTGKTTLVPPAVANLLAAAARPEDVGKVIVCAPRRLAVRAAADRLRHLAGAATPRGLIGHRMRGDSRPGTAVEFVTPAVLVRMLLSSPELPGVGAIVIDEVHERQLDMDLALAFSLELAELREDLKLVVMSATLPTEDFARLLGGAPVVATPAVTHPLKIKYAPHPGRLYRERRAQEDFYAHLARLADEAVAATGHSALVFVPGTREVDAVVHRCHTVAFPLHGRLDRAAQRAAMASGAEPRVVVSTAVAESSVTVPGVRAVVDSGLSRVPRRDAGRGMQGLVTVSESRATAIQRTGRAGREGPGVVLRAFDEQDFRHFDEHSAPEIATADLTQAALWMAAWGTPRGAGLPLPTEPPAAALGQACAALRRIGATASDDAATPLGRELSGLPLDPRLGRALLECGPGAAPALAALAAGESGDLARARPPAAEVARLEKLAARPHRASGGSGAAASVTRRADSPGVAVALAFPERVARLEAPGEYLLASGTRAMLPQDLGLSGAEWLAVGEATRSSSSGSAGRPGATIRSAARIDAESAQQIVGVTEEEEAQWREGAVRARRIRKAGAIELSRTPTAASPSTAARVIAAEIRAQGLSFFPLSATAQGLVFRLGFLHAQLGEPWPDLEALDPTLWLAPEIERLARGAGLGSIDITAALHRVLPWPEAAELSTLAPERLEVPSGSHPLVDYASGRPVVRVKLQECFGLAESPRLAGARVQFRLLSPAGRDLAVTDDLESFWSGSYHQVRAEMRGRYPKHPWPENPWAAQATTRTTKGARK